MNGINSNHSSYPLNTQGWTIVELMTTMVIIAISAYFAAPEIISWQRNMRVASAARGLYGEMNNARVVSVEKNANVVLELDSGNNEYKIFIDDGAGAGIPGNNVKDGSETYLVNSVQFNADSGVFIDNASLAGPIGFTPRGMPLNTGNILLRNAGSNLWFKIVINNAGSLSLLKSTNSTDGGNGTWK